MDFALFTSRIAPSHPENTKILPMAGNCRSLPKRPPTAVTAVR